MKDIKSLNILKTLKEQLTSYDYSRFEPLDFHKLDTRFANLTSDPDLAVLDLYTNSSTIGAGDLFMNGMVGQYQAGTNGRWFRLAEVGASALVRSNVIQSKAVDAQFTGMAVLAASIATSGLQTVTVTNGTTTVNATDFANGSISVYTTPDLGSDYVITGHTANVTSGGAITVTLDRYLQNAWTTATKVNMRTNPWKYVIQSPATTLTGTPVGVAVFAAAASTVASGATDANPGQYTWLQTHGVGAVLSDATSILVGSQIAVPGGTAGAVTLAVAGLPSVGVAMQAASSTHAISAFLTID